MDSKTEDALKKFNDQLGGFGKFQKYIIFLTSFVFIMAGTSALNYVFIAYDVSYRCAIPTCENPINSSYEDIFLNFTTPLEENSKKWSSCSVFALKNDNGSTSCNENEFSSLEMEECSQWVYDKSIFESTLVSEFNLTCGRSWLQSVASSAYMFGMPFGALILGDLGDRIGRRKGLMAGITIAVLGEFAATFSLNFYMYFACKFLSGAGSSASYSISLIQALEVVHPDKRTLCGTVMKILFSIAQASPSVIAYFIRSWRWLQLTLSLPFFLLFSYWWLLPESIRWLLSKGKYDDARRAMQRAAAMNEVEISSDVYDELCTNKKEGETEQSSEASKRSSFDLFKTPRLRRKTFVLIFLWIIIIHAYYNTSLNSAYFGGTIFTNFFLAMVVDIPANIFVYFSLNKWGRKGTLVLLLFIGGVAGISSSFIETDLELALVAINMGSKFCAAAATSSIYIYTIEIFSTQYRSLGLGMCSMSARVGGILAPFTSRLAKIYRPLPLIITGSSCLIGVMLALFLPETLDQELPQTIEDSENYGADQKLLYFVCFSTEKKESRVKNSKPNELSCKQ